MTNKEHTLVQVFSPLSQVIAMIILIFMSVSCTTVKRPNLQPWKPPSWVQGKHLSKHLQNLSSTTLTTFMPTSKTQLIQTPIQPSAKEYSRNSQKNAFWQQKVSLNFEGISLKKAIDGLARSYQFSYRNLLPKSPQIKHYRAINTPLNTILQDLGELTDSRIIIGKKSVIISENKAFWVQYSIDYPNIKRTSLSKSQFNQNVGAISNNPQAKANVEISNEFKNDFWKHLEKIFSAFTTNPASATTNTSIIQTANKILIHPETGAVSVYGKQSLHRQIEKIIHNINQQARRQAHIEMAIMEVTLNDEYKAGIDWSLFENNNNISQQTLGANLGSAPRIVTNISGVLDGISLNFGARLIEQFGNTKVLSSPQIRLINNQTALLKVVDNIIYFTIKTDTIQNNSVSTVSFATKAKSVSVGIVISLTATILPDNSLIINLKPTLSRIAQFVNDPHPELAKNKVRSLVPVLRERELESFLHIRPNEVAVIGGLIQNRNSQNATQSPGSSGLLGFDSKQANNTELILFLRANIL